MLPVSQKKSFKVQLYGLGCHVMLLGDFFIGGLFLHKVGNKMFPLFFEPQTFGKFGISYFFE